MDESGFVWIRSTGEWSFLMNWTFFKITKGLKLEFKSLDLFSPPCLHVLILLPKYKT